MNESSSPLLSDPNWNEEIASKVAFDHNGTTAYITFCHGVLKLYNPETKHVFDRIKVNDIIGVELELSFDGYIPNKSIRGMEKMKRLEDSILRKQSPSDISNESLTSSKATLNIYAYPKRISRGFLSQIKSFFRKDESIDYIGEKDESELSYGHRYEKHRKFILQPVEDLSLARSLAASIRQVAQLEEIDRHLRYLVFVNPFSGTKKGKQTYDFIVKKMLDERGVDHDVLVTKRSGHAKERVMDTYELLEGERNLIEYDGIIALGGDGILSEILQGLRTRADYDDIMNRFKFGIVGCGTSNGLAASLLFAAKEQYGPLESTYLICKGGYTKLDLSVYQTKTQQYISFLTFSWAMIADIDIESEAVRFLGILRNDVWAAWRVLSLRSYRAKFSYLPIDHNLNSVVELPDLNSDVPSNWITLDSDFILFWASHVSHAASNTLQSPQSTLGNGKFNIFFIRKPCSRISILRILLSLETGSHTTYEKAEFIQCAAYRLDPLTKGSFNDIDGEVAESGLIQACVIPGIMKMFSSN